MCKKIEHEMQISRNQNLFSYLKNLGMEERYFEWEIVVIYYIVIHHCESILSEINVHNKKHEIREDYLLDNVYRKFNCTDTREMENAYRKIKIRCNRARYEAVIPTAKDIQESENYLQRFVIYANRYLVQHVNDKKSS